MAGRIHEIRDPIHVFIRLDSDEREVLNSPPVQRLREIHQLALTYLVYPGATHRRFEHSLGVMELATRIFDVVMAEQNLHHGSVKRIVGDSRYWRKVLRMAALCHDVGHLPFSHAAESELLPDGWDHERLTLQIIMSDVMAPYWEHMDINPEDVAKLALGPKYPNPENMTDWEATLADIIVSDVFGADRMDYLLRDSYHAGVAYGRFDHYRLIDTLRILPSAEEGSEQPELGIEEGGLQSAESLLWARYFMYTQLYFHPVRRIYDIHLKEFLQAWLPEGIFPTDVAGHLSLSDVEVLAAMRSAVLDDTAPGHDPARRVSCREHFRMVYKPLYTDRQRSPEPARLVEEALAAEFGPDAVRRDAYAQKGGRAQFPVYTKTGQIQNSSTISSTLNEVPTFAVDYVYVDPERSDEAARWLEENRDRIIREQEPEEG